jgi:hypothetical protein
MSSKIILITALILTKIIVVASRTNAVEVYFACSTETEFQLINTYTSPTYRCGNSPSFKRI